MLIKIFKFLVGLALLPLCIAATETAVHLLMVLRPDSASAMSAPVWGFLLGFGLWMLLFFLLPHPVKTYIFAHEMSHLLWGFMMGARVSKMRVDEDGGSVTVSKNNFLIVLAPYFFPFYSIATLLVYALLSAFTDLNTYKPFWMGLLGLTWAFHLSFTARMLREHQSDISSQGRIFSYVLIYLLNLTEVCILIVAMGTPTLKMFLSRLTNETIDAYGFCQATMLRASAFLRGIMQ